MKQILSLLNSMVLICPHVFDFKKYAQIIKTKCLCLQACVLLLGSTVAFGQLPAGGVIFDDFDYVNIDWCNEAEGGCGAFGGQPPAGSLFGANVWRTSDPGAATTTEVARAWYRFSWQELFENQFPTGTYFDVTSTPGYLAIGADAGNYTTADLAGRSARTVASGFHAFRGTWAASVNFSDLEPAAAADLFQAFWLWSPIFGRNASGTNVNVELDFEWNNRFLGTGQQYPFLRTGHTVGNASTANDNHTPLEAPAWPDGSTNPVTQQLGLDWTCKYYWGNQLNQADALDGDECSDVINQVFVDQNGNVPLSDPEIRLFLQITDTDIFYAVSSFGWGGVLIANSEHDNLVPNLPVISKFSQYMPNPSFLGADQEIQVDWFYYTPNTTVSINDVGQHVSTIRGLSTPRFNNTGIDLERPVEFRNGFVSNPDLTSVLTINNGFDGMPASMAPGQTETLVAMPPIRNGTYRFTWRYRRTIQGLGTLGWQTLNARYGGWEAVFSFPGRYYFWDVSYVDIEVTLEELDGSGNVVNNAKVSPITETFRIWNSDIWGMFEAYTEENAPLLIQEEAIPEKFDLYQNYPNPFNPSTAIRFALPEATHVSLVIYDTLGRQVAELVNEQMDKGYHQVQWNANGLPSGTYAYQIKTVEFTRTKLMVLTK